MLEYSHVPIPTVVASPPAASAAKPPLGNSGWSADRPDTAARAARAEQSSTPMLRELQTHHRLQY